MKNNKNKKTYILLYILFISIFIILLLGSSFAYFTARVNGEYHYDSIKTAKLGTAVAEGTAVYLVVSNDDMQLVDGSNEYAAYKEPDEESTLRLWTDTGDLNGIECTYDILYSPTKAYNKSSANNANYKEFTINGTHEIVGDSSYISISGNMEEVDLTTVTAPIKVVSGAKLIVNGKNAIGEAVWKIKPRYYNLAISQDDNKNVSFGGTLEVGSLVCLSK